nr:MAG TPA: hypothetical protein [Caudoviricetes sp.]DAM52545.1 MAG TPA: hypothetical protein [Caudoviricetes sp.]
MNFANGSPICNFPENSPYLHLSYLFQALVDSRKIKPTLRTHQNLPTPGNRICVFFRSILRWFRALCNAYASQTMCGTVCWSASLSIGGLYFFCIVRKKLNRY